jgi:hypothetical protein
VLATCQGKIYIVAKPDITIYRILKIADFIFRWSDEQSISIMNIRLWIMMKRKLLLRIGCHINETPLLKGNYSLTSSSWSGSAFMVFKTHSNLATPFSGDLQRHYDPHLPNIKQVSQKELSRLLIYFTVIIMRCKLLYDDSRST